ncbi:FlaA1/EpsC-like NDP-sugar epimerase [Salinibacterium sp. CAN_S4]|uniref:polysaccharide biosynthesis protein n=1 Tax=Salinibacterium sp. CAN_S4 TaxID=2787727 RepID=UPI0018EF72E0
MSLPAHFRPELLLGNSTDPVYGAEARELIRGKIVMVTGAGGSIGSELVLQAKALGAARVCNVDTDEFALYSLQLGMEGRALLDDDDYILADIRDESLMDRVVRANAPDVIFHAAAHKHLPLLERFPDAAAKTNVFGTESVVRAAVTNGVSRVVNISTDKAASPTSALGWSKKLAEQVAASYSTDATVISSVRFGNVLGSRGSFLPTLMWQISQGIPIQITHKDVSRFFMTIPEAAGLVIESSRLAEGGDVFVLDMGTSIRIVDLVKEYVRISGSADPHIVYTGLRDGEKMQETCFESEEDQSPTAHPRILSANIESVDTTRVVAELRELVAEGAPAAIIREALEFSKAVAIA